MKSEDVLNSPSKFAKPTKKETRLEMEGLAIPKKIREKKPKKKLRQNTRLKSKYDPVPKEVFESLLEEKGRFCFMGECEHCGGLSEATDPHHFPHKGKNKTPNLIKYLWPANRFCHSYYHDHPLEEKELFKKLETLGYKVYWKVEESKLQVIDGQ
jgi:hypothetical protein